MIIGVGNGFRGDDAAGLVAARRLRSTLRVPVRELEGDPAKLMDAWENCESVILVDAVSSGSPPGTLHRFDAHEAPLPSTLFRGSTHAFGVPDVIELARALHRLPRKLVVYGIEARNFTAGEGLSPEVEDAVERVVQRIEKECGHA